jgi:HAD superfamily hydrolase (TIGR01509 family)
MIKAIIFDMDDTLVDSIRIHKKSFGEALKKYSADIEKIPKEIEQHLPGKKGIEVAKIFQQYFSINETPEKIHDERNKILFGLLKNIKPMPGYEKLLQYLKKTDLKIALASSGTKKHINETLKNLEIKKFLKVITSGEEVSKGKPEPDIFLLTAKKLKIKTSECIVVEDAISGVKAGKTAGMKVIGIPHKNPSVKQNLSEADIIINNLGEIEKTIKKLSKK